MENIEKPSFLSKTGPWTKFAPGNSPLHVDHTYYWPSPFAYTNVPESDYLEKSQNTFGVFGNFSAIY